MDPGANIEIFRRVKSMLGFEPLIIECVGETIKIYRNKVGRPERTNCVCVCGLRDNIGVSYRNMV